MRLKETKEVVEMIKRIEAGGGGGGETDGGYKVIQIPDEGGEFNLWEYEPGFYKVQKNEGVSIYFRYGPGYTSEGSAQRFGMSSSTKECWLFISAYKERDGKPVVGFDIIENEYIRGGYATDNERNAHGYSLSLNTYIQANGSPPEGREYIHLENIALRSGDRRVYYRVATPPKTGYTATLLHAYDSGSRELVEDEDDDTTLWDFTDVLWDETGKPIFPTSILFDGRDEDGNGKVDFFTIESMEAQNDFDDIIVIAKNSTKTATITALAADDYMWYITITQNS